jgi:nucleotide-binding universal stress UspA family protein
MHCTRDRIEVGMTSRPRIVCAVDFSESSRTALRSAAILAERFQALLTVATVDDPLLAPVDMARSARPRVVTANLVRGFVAETLGDRAIASEIEHVVGVGRPADELLRIARDQRAALLVMSGHGLTGIRKLFFGSTTERVLRESDIPVLVTESGVPAPASWADMITTVGRVLIPVDLLPGTEPQVEDALRIAEALRVPALVTHVIEPTRLPAARRQDAHHIDVERRARADQALDALLRSVPGTLRPEGLVAYGDPAEEIAKVARDRQAGLIVMGLRASGSPRGRMGSVTYRVLCVSHAAVLALPPTSLALALTARTPTASVSAV